MEFAPILRGEGQEQTFLWDPGKLLISQFAVTKNHMPRAPERGTGNSFRPLGKHVSYHTLLCPRKGVSKVAQEDIFGMLLLSLRATTTI